MTPRPLTQDERKAAEAAFQAKPLNPDWTAQAQHIYWRIYDVKHHVTSVQRQPSPSLQPSFSASPNPPLSARPVQAWHIHFLDVDDHVVMLFPIQHSTTELLAMIKRLNPDRPFRMQPLKQGHFPLEAPDLLLLRSLFAQDPRHLTHEGEVKLHRDDPPSSILCSRQ